MTPSSRSRADGPAADQMLYERLKAYARYVSLVQAQKGAAEDGDLERYAELSDARQEIQNELGDAPLEIRRAPSSIDPEARRLLEMALADLRRAAATDALNRQALADLRKEAADSIRTMDDRKGQVKKYLGAGETSGPASSSRVNFKG